MKYRRSYNYQVILTNNGWNKPTVINCFYWKEAVRTSYWHKRYFQEHWQIKRLRDGVILAQLKVAA